MLSAQTLYRRPHRGTVGLCLFKPRRDALINCPKHSQQECSVAMERLSNRLASPRETLVPPLWSVRTSQVIKLGQLVHLQGLRQ